MRKQIFKAIAQRIAERCPDIKFIDLWNEHVVEVATSVPWPLPAVFIEFEQYEVRQLSRWQREADIPVRLHIVTRWQAYTAGAADKRIDTALQYFDLIDRVNAAMQGLSGTGFTAFQLTASATNHNHGELMENIERWQTRAVDATAKRHAFNHGDYRPRIDTRKAAPHFWRCSLLCHLPYTGISSQNSKSDCSSAVGGGGGGVGMSR